MKQQAQGHAKKPRPHRSKSQSKPPAVADDDSYAMGSYDNEPIVDAVSTPSWRRSPPNGSSDAPSPVSPMSQLNPATGAPHSAPGASHHHVPHHNNVLAPIPFHLNPYGAPMAPPPPLAAMHGAPPLLPPSLLGSSGAIPPPPASNGTYPHPMIPFSSSNTPNNAATGISGVGGPGGMVAPPASAPPLARSNSQHMHQIPQNGVSNPTPVPHSTDEHQATIARILALQKANNASAPTAHHANGSISAVSTIGASGVPSTTPVVPSPHVPNGFMPISSHTPPVSHNVSNPFFSGPPAPSASVPVMSSTHGQLHDTSQHAYPSEPFTESSASRTPASSHGNTTSVSLDHLLGMQQQVQQTQQSIEQLKLSSQPHSINNPHMPSSISLWQLQQQLHMGPGKPVQLTVSGDGALKVSHPRNAVDQLFEAPTTRQPLKTSSKGIPAPRTTPIHAHHNYGLPAQP